MPDQISTHLRRALSALALAAAIAAPAMAQQRVGPNGLIITGRSLLTRTQPLPGSTGISGVKARLPGPIPGGISGVKARLPGPIGNRGSLLPPPPPRTPNTPGVHGHTGGHRSSPRTYANRFGDYSRRDSRGPIYDSRSGLRVDGSYSDGPFDLRFSLNSGGVIPLVNHRGGYGHVYGRGHGAFYSPAYRYWNYSDLYGYSGWYDDGGAYAAPPVVGAPVYIDPALLAQQMQGQAPPPATPPTPLTTLEKADLSLAYGEPDDAVRFYREHLESNPEDAPAMRSLGVALIQARRVKEGVAVIALAYEKDVTLARRPLDPEMVEDGDVGFHDVLLSVVPYANKSRSASGYLAVAVLMQAQGRNDLALKMLAKAKQAGLGEKIAGEMELELSR